MKHIDSFSHVRGESLYVDDVPLREHTLYAVPVGSPVAHGVLNGIAVSAEASAGTVTVLTAQDIPGENQIGGILPDEPLLAEGRVHYRGQPVALVIAESEAAARAARDLIKVEVEEEPPVVDPREAYARGEIIGRQRTFRRGDADAALARCRTVVSGTAEVGGQEHLYIETQGAYAVPAEGGGVHVISSTQGPTAVQRGVARVLGLSMHRVEVEVTRLGGGFGGKEDQATHWAVLAALGAQATGRPVKLVLHRMDDMAMTGKRHPYSADFTIGLDDELRIVAYRAMFYQNAGAAADLSPAVLERTLFHATNSYFVPHVEVTAASCRTHLPPNTAFRGFGGPQGMFVIESAIARAAETLGVPREEIQERNLIRPQDVFPYGQTVETDEARTTWSATRTRYATDDLRREIDAFNRTHPAEKKGMAWMPVTFGISFTKTYMNQARALVHVYTDGSVGVSTGAVEMGQGVNTKMVQVAARELGLPAERIKMETTNTTRVANTSPSAASSSSDLNGKALAGACRAIRERLAALAAQRLGHGDPGRIGFLDGQITDGQAPAPWTWDELVREAHFARVNLSEHHHYRTPGIGFDPETETGSPFAYYAHGTAVVTVTVDCLRGRYRVDGVRVVHDFGESMNRTVDLGQAEGGIVQGVGWMTMEELRYDGQGRLMTGALSTYKVPDIYAVPRVVEVEFLPAPGNPLALYRSKAVGEPPLMYGIGAYFALRDAVRAFRPEAEFECVAPMTPERLLSALYPAGVSAPAGPPASSRPHVLPD